MNTESLLQELRTATRVTLRPSPVHGIGVFAIARIPAGFTEIFSRPSDNWVNLPIAEVEKLPAHSRDLVETYCLFDETHYFVPDYGFKIMDLVNYLNHSSTPNVRSVNEGDQFEAIRDIEPGEELFVDYGSIVNVEGY